MATRSLKDTKRYRIRNANANASLLADGLLSIGTLAISAAAAEKFKTTTTAYYTLDGIQYSKAATDNLVFSANDTINTGTAEGDFFGVWLVQVNAAGTVSTKSPATDQSYTSADLALGALPTADANNTALGYIIIGANTDSAWTANTDDMTPASDCASAVFEDSALKAVATV